MSTVAIPIKGGVLHGEFSNAAQAKGIVIFAHGSGSSRHSPRNRMVAKVLEEAGFRTLLFDLLTEEEENREKGGEFRFNIDLLSKRLSAVIDWARQQSSLPIGLFGASTGAAAALKASVHSPIFAIVSRGGRPDLATDALAQVKAPTLLIVGGEDLPVIEMNQSAQKSMTALVKLCIVEGASHLFEEKGKLEKVAALAKEWFLQHVP